MGKILVNEDDVEMGLAITRALTNHQVILASSTSSARAMLEKDRFDLLLLDICLPDGNGLQFIAELGSNEAFKNTPTLFVTGRNDLGEKLIAFSLGADDFIVKPFDLRELRARIDNRIRRAQQGSTDDQVLRRGNLSIHKSSQKVTLRIADQETPVDLSAFAFRILTFFAENEDVVLSRNTLLERLWGGNTYIFDRTIDAHICKIRKKLKGADYTIHSIYGHGYVFRKSPRREKDEPHNTGLECHWPYQKVCHRHTPRHTRSQYRLGNQPYY